MTRRPLDEETLRQALRALAEAEKRIEIPAHVEAAVMAKWDAAYGRRGRSATRRLVRTAGAMAAGVTLVSAVAVERELASGPVTLPQRPAPSFETPRASLAHGIPDLDVVAPLARATESRVDESRSAVVLVGQPIAEGEVVHVVRMRVTRASLRVFGVSAPASAEMVDIDVVVGEDGVARGVRVPL